MARAWPACDKRLKQARRAAACHLIAQVPDAPGDKITDLHNDRLALDAQFVHAMFNRVISSVPFSSDTLDEQVETVVVHTLEHSVR